MPSTDEMTVRATLKPPFGLGVLTINTPKLRYAALEGGTNIRHFICAILACLGLAGLAGGAQPTSRSIAPLPPAGTVAEGMALTSDEKTILSAVRDHSGQLDEQGLFVLLRRAAALPQLSRQEFDKIAPAVIGQLLSDPDVMRCKPMRLRLRVFKAEKWMPGQEIALSLRWMSDHAVWYLTGLDNTGNTPTKQPVIVLSAVDPSLILGRPQRIGAGGEMIYPSGQNIELAGIFYKVFTGPSIDEQKAATQGRQPATSDYPVIVGWQIMPAPPLISDEAKEIAGIILAALALCASYIYVRRRISTLRRANQLQTTVEKFYSGGDSCISRNRQDEK